MRTNNTKQFSEKSSIFYWMDKLIYYKRQSGKDSTADLYRATRNWLYRFIHRRNLSVFQITSSLIDNFVNYLKRLGHLRMNSINSYLSGFRAMYNQIIRKMNYQPYIHPFAHVRIRLEKTVKRAVCLKTIEQIAQLDLRGNPHLDLAADICTFSFLACGIPFVDLVHLTYHNIEGNTLVYHRMKTRTLIRVEITSGMQHLLNKYASNSPYLFPVLPSQKVISHEQYKSLLRKYNNNLKKLGDKVNISVPFTSFVIRHTWATEAHRHYIPIALISQALGHTTEKTTHYYLAQLDQSELSKANARVVKTIDKLIVEKSIP